MQFKLGEWLVACDRCGWKRYASQVVETWDGLIVCKPSIKEGCFETRHPQDFIKQVKDDPSVPFIRSRSTDVYVAPVCSVTGRQGLANYGEANCAVVHLDLGER